VTGLHLAQVNVAMPKAPLDSAELAGFVALLSPVNELADASPGFVWRLQTEDGDATAVRAFGDDRLLINLSVWESLESLGSFVYESGHVLAMRRRREWFVMMAEAHVCLWWVPVGTTPTIADAEERLTSLRTNGPSPFAFTFREPFGTPGGRSAGPVATDDWFCPA
jgi:uncharacterized protein DUF3291